MMSWVQRQLLRQFCRHGGASTCHHVERADVITSTSVDFCCAACLVSQHRAGAGVGLLSGSGIPDAPPLCSPLRSRMSANAPPEAAFWAWP